MNFDDIKDRLISEFRQLLERIQESGLYNNLKDRYENLSPTMQKLTVFGGAFLVILFLFSYPYDYYSNSQTQLEDFESKRDLIRQMLKVSKEASDTLDLPAPPSIDSLRASVDSMLKQAQLLPEQIKGIEALPGDHTLIASNLNTGLLKVSLAKLNLRQIVDLGFQLQNINPSVKMTDLEMNANNQDGRYFDIVYKLVALKVPQKIEQPVEIEPPANKKNKKPTKSLGKDSKSEESE